MIRSQRLPTVGTLCMVCTLLGFTQTAVAQVVARATVEKAAATPTVIATGSDVLAIVPFSLEDSRILFEVEFDGIRGTYVFDTGAPFTAFSAQYIRPGKHIGANPTIDTVPASDRQSAAPPQGSGMRHEELQSLITLHQMKIGTLTHVLPPTDIGPPKPAIESNAVLYADNRYENFARPVFGSFGLNAMEPFEIIIDYPQHQLIFIRLDSAGHPLATVPQHMLVGKAPLVPFSDQYWWGVNAALGSPATMEVLLVDAGSKYNFLTDETIARLGGHVTVLSDASGAPIDLLDHLTVGDKTINDVDMRPLNTPTLGHPFLSQLGIVGFNFRTREFSWYK